jgi:capsular exopolysaccharide synthesis family protein
VLTNVPTTDLRFDNSFSRLEGNSTKKSLIEQVGFYLQTIMNNLVLIIGCTVVAGLLALVYALTSPRGYTTQAKLRVSSYVPVLPGKSQAEDVLRQQTSEDEYFITQLEELVGLPIADKVLSDKAVRQAISRLDSAHPLNVALNSHDVASSDKSVDSYRHSMSALYEYLSHIAVQPVKRSSLIEVSSTFPTPELAAIVANKHSELFIAQVKENFSKQTQATLTFLEMRSKELHSRIAEVEGKLADYAKEYSIISIDKDYSINLQQVAEVSRMVTEARGARIRSESDYEEASKKTGLTSSFVDDDSILKLREALSIARADYAKGLEKFTPDYPLVKQIRARLEELKRTLQSERVSVIAAKKAIYAADKAVEESLMEELEELKDKAFALEKVKVEYNSMEREFDSLKDLQQSVLRQLKEAQLRLGGGASNISLAESAPLPQFPSKPRKKIIVLLGIFLGAMIGLALSFILDLINQQIKTPDELEGVSGLPTLGVVPNLGMQTPTKSLVTIESPYSAASEAFRNLRAGIRLSAIDSRLSSILVTSGAPNVGKTTVAANLAIAFAQDGSRTLFVDCDLRRAEARSYFPKSPLVGLSDLLTGQVSLEECITNTPPGNGPRLASLFFLGAGSKAPNPAELVGSLKMQHLLKKLREEFDYVIIDSAPILPVADSLLLARLVDGVLLVSRADASTQNEVFQAVSKLKGINARIIGTILNDLIFRKFKFFFTSRDSFSRYPYLPAEISTIDQRKAA